MATYQFTNTKAAQALRGQAVLVTVNTTNQSHLADISEGDLATMDSTGITGTVNRVDYFGLSFTVNPIQPDRAFGIYGYLNASETVTVTY